MSLFCLRQTCWMEICWYDTGTPLTRVLCCNFLSRKHKVWCGFECRTKTSQRNILSLIFFTACYIAETTLPQHWKNSLTRITEQQSIIKLSHINEFHQNNQNGTMMCMSLGLHFSLAVISWCLLTFLIGQPDVTNKSSAFCSKKVKTFCFTSSTTRNFDILTKCNITHTLA